MLRSVSVHRLSLLLVSDADSCLGLAVFLAGEVGKLLGAKWKELDESEKKPYVEQAAQDKHRAEQEKAEYDVRCLSLSSISLSDASSSINALHGSVGQEGQSRRGRRGVDLPPRVSSLHPIPI